MIWRMLTAVALTVVAVTSIPSTAVAVGWPVGVGSEPTLRFGDDYLRLDGSTATHSGVDVPAGPGDAVLSVDAGTVTFAGRIPSAAGGSILAVTIESSTGTRWSYMPLGDLGVAAGQAMEPGDAIGTVAAAGDPSTDATHVHVGLRRGDLYVDPLSLLVAPALEAEVEDVPTQIETATDPAATSVAAQAGVLPEIATDGQQVIGEASQPMATSAIVNEASMLSSPEAPPVGAAVAGGDHVVTESIEDIVVSPTLSEVAAPHEAAGAVRAAGFARTHAGAAVHSRFSQPSTRPGTPLGSRLALAVSALGPAVGASLIRWFRSRVTAPGDTVAAVVGR